MFHNDLLEVVFCPSYRKNNYRKTVLFSIVINTFIINDQFSIFIIKTNHSESIKRNVSIT